MTVVGVGLVGLGTVGQGVYKLLSRFPGCAVKQIAVRDTTKIRSIDDLDINLLTRDAQSLLSNPDIQLIVEVMGGLDLAYQLVTDALKRGKHVVTANKALIATHGPELFALAQANNVRLLFEGAVAGGIPIIMPLKLSLAANQIEEIAGILNGTTNYILSRMSHTGASFEEALKEAQAKGFAEADPTSDVEGIDTSYKIAILATMAFKHWVDPADVYCEGITNIGAVDIQHARSLGYAIKLIGRARTTETDAIDIRVHPMLVPLEHPLASIHAENNAVWIRGHAVGDVMFYGKGAGELPTASAVTADILAISQDLNNGNTPPIPGMQLNLAEGTANLQTVSDTRNKYYVRLLTNDAPGVIGQLGVACGDHGVSLESVMQMHTCTDGTASIVLVTHDVTEGQMNAALNQIKAQSGTRTVACLLRVW